MVTVTISKKEYRELMEKKLKYEYIKGVFREDVFVSPPTKKTEEILKAFDSTKLYNKKFLKSLGKGLRRSPYFKK